MTQYDNEFFRGPPEGSPTLATDQRPTGVEVFQAKPERVTTSGDAPVTREEVPEEPPKKKSNARRITKAIKLLASCMAAVVITEAAVNIAATVEPPPEVPTGQYYVGQWPAVLIAENGELVLDMDAVDGNIVQARMEGASWRFTAGQDWRILWLDQNLFIEDVNTGISGRLNMRMHPYMSIEEDAVYGDVTTSTGETLYFRGFMKGGGSGAPGENLEEQQEAMDDFIAGLTVTPATEDGWQGLQIGRKLYTQQSEDWYGLGGHGDLEIDIPWVCDSEDYNLQNMTPYARETVNGITWSIYFTEDDLYLWAVPNIDPEICLGGYASRFMCADAVRRGEYINDDEWLEMGGFTSTAQRQTAVDILIECLQHHYALRDRWYPREWPWKGATDDATLWIWAESLRGTWAQFSFGDEAYRVNCTDPELRFYWEATSPNGTDVEANLEISRMVQNKEEFAINLSVCRSPFSHTRDNCAYRTAQTSDGKTLYLEFGSHYRSTGADFTTAEMENLADEILRSLTFQSNPNDSGWMTTLLCDTMHSPSSMKWSGCGIVGSRVEIRYIHTVEGEGLSSEVPCATRTFNGITWSLYYDLGNEEYERTIWAVPDIEPDVCLGISAETACDYYRSHYPDTATGGWNAQYDVPAEDVSYAVEVMAECLSHIYPLGVEPDEGWYIPDWPKIGQITADHSYSLMDYSKFGTYTQFSLGDASYRLDSGNSSLCFFWDGTAQVNGVMQADIHINHMVDHRRQWRVELFVQDQPFSAAKDEEIEIDATLPASDGSPLYLRFRCTWYKGQGPSLYEAFSGWVRTVMESITASPARPNEWGQVWICDLMTTPLDENWDGNAMVTDHYEIPYFNRAEEQGLKDLEPYAMLEFNGITWTFIYEEEDDIIWGIPDIEDRWCIGAPAKEMAAWITGKIPEEDYLDAAVEGLSYGLSKYHPRRGFVQEPEDPKADVLSFSHEAGKSTQISLGNRGYRLTTTLDDFILSWLWSHHEERGVPATVSIGNINQGAIFAEVDIFQEPVAAEDGQLHGQLETDTGEILYWYCGLLMRGGEADLTTAMENIEVSEARPDGWGKVWIRDNLYSQQGIYWSGMETIEPDGSSNTMLINLEYVADLDLGEPIVRQRINGIEWTIYIMEEYSSEAWPFIWAVPDIDPDIAIGSDYVNAVYKYFEDTGTMQDFDGDLWSYDSKIGAATMIFIALQNYYPQ